MCIEPCWTECPTRCELPAGHLQKSAGHVRHVWHISRSLDTSSNSQRGAPDIDIIDPFHSYSKELDNPFDSRKAEILHHKTNENQWKNCLYSQTGKPWVIPCGACMGFRRGCPCPYSPRCALDAPYQSRTGSDQERYLGYDNSMETNNPMAILRLPPTSLPHMGSVGP